MGLPCQTHQLQYLLGLPSGNPPIRGSTKGSNHDVFFNGQKGHYLHSLKRPGYPHFGDTVGRPARNVLPIEKNLSIGGLIITRNAIEQRCLAGSIRADKTHDLPSFQLQGNIGVGYQSSEFFN